MAYYFFLSVALVPLGVGLVKYLIATLGSRRCGNCDQLMPHRYANSSFPCFACGKALDMVHRVFWLRSGDLHPNPEFWVDAPDPTLVVTEVSDVVHDMPIIDAVRNGHLIVSDCQPRSMRSAIGQMTRIVTIAFAILYSIIGVSVVSAVFVQGGNFDGDVIGPLIIAVVFYLLMWAMFVASAVLIELLRYRRIVVYRDRIAVLDNGEFACAAIRDVKMNAPSRLMKAIMPGARDARLILSSSRGNFMPFFVGFSAVSSEFIETYVTTIQAEE